MSKNTLLNTDNFKKLFNIDEIKKYFNKNTNVDNVLIAIIVIYIIFFSYRIPLELSIIMKNQIFRVFIIIAIIYLCYHNTLCAILLTIAYIITIVVEKKQKNTISIKEKFKNKDDDDSDDDNSDDDDDTDDDYEDDESDEESDEDEKEDIDDENQQEYGNEEDDDDIDGDESLEQYRTDNPSLTDNFKKLHDTLHKYESFLKQK